MFNTDNIYTDFTGKRFLCDCLFNSEKTAKYVESKFLMSVREYYRPADLYVKGNKLILDTPSINKTKELTTLLNNSIKMLAN